MNVKDRILIVEDDKNIINLLKTILKANNYQVSVAENGEDASGIITSQCPDLILLDLGLPDVDGLNILRFVRSYSETPIIVVSARSHERDKVEALDMGADDYISKPFGSSELLARVRTGLRHHRTFGRMESGTQTLALAEGHLLLDYAKHKVFVEGRDACLTQNEYRLVAILARFPGRVITYDYLMKEIWGPNLNEDNRILRVNMANIRRKLEKNPASPEYIFTEAGVGYRITD